jgi:hypothetical protein
MMEDLLTNMTRTIAQFTLKYWVIYILSVLSYLIVAFRHRIDYLFMKNDLVWCKWYRSAYRCPACVIRLRPADYPPNYRCLKCGNTYSFGDPAAKAWIDSKPLLTRGEFFRYISLLAFLAIGALWLFSSGVLG